MKIQTDSIVFQNPTQQALARPARPRSSADWNLPSFQQRSITDPGMTLPAIPKELAVKMMVKESGEEVRSILCRCNCVDVLLL